MINKLKRVNFAATGRDIHIDIPLSNVAMNYRPEGMIADMIAPVVAVPNLSGIIPSFDRGEIHRVEATRRAPGTPANEITREVSSDNYYADNYALAHGVNIEDRANADPIYVQTLFNGAATYLVDKLFLDWENRVATQVTNTSNVGSSAAVSSGWTDYANSDPLTDVQTAIDNLIDANGITDKNNIRVVFGESAWRNIRRNTSVRNLIFGTNNGGGYPAVEPVRDLLDVGQVMVGQGFQNTANEGQAEALSQIWGDNVLVYYAPSAPSIFTPSFLYSFRWNAAGIPNMQAERHAFDTVRKRELVEVGYYQDEKITGSSYSFLLTAVNSST